MKPAGLVVVTGGTRSGKSGLAEEMAAAGGDKVVYLATAYPHDPEMTLRVKKHRDRRPASWRTCEAPLKVRQALVEESGQAEVILLDSMGMWISNLLSEMTRQEEDWQKCEEVMEAVMVEVREMIRVARDVKAQVIIVTEEVGMGLVPVYPVGRVFCDLLGQANEEAARFADKVYFVVAGIPMLLKNTVD